MTETTQITPSNDSDLGAEVVYWNPRSYQPTLDDCNDRTSVKFSERVVAVAGYWDGNSGEWSPEWLGATLDFEAAKDLRDRLSAWIEEQA